MQPDATAILNSATEHYLTSGDFNGTPMRAIDAPDDVRKAIVSDLVHRGSLSLNFGDRHMNPYVQALPPEPIDRQIEKLMQSTDLTHVCMYPTASHLQQIVSPADYRDRPFSHRLALGEPLFTSVPFELRVLEHYRNDPRYGYQTDDIQGWIGARDEFCQSDQMKERDQILLKQFGFGYDDEMKRCVMAMLCDLAILSAEHQQIWRQNQLDGDYTPHPNFIDSVAGRRPAKESIFRAFTAELQVINGMCDLMGRPRLFRNDFSAASRPRKFGFLIRPTLAEFNDFVLLLDRMMSDNMNLDFFQGEVPLEFLEDRPDGAKIARQKGSIRVLQEWLESRLRFPDPGPKDQMIATFKRVRKLRQSPAHTIDEDEFDQKYFKDQRVLVIDAYEAIRQLRLILANHPEARKYEVPDWLYEGNIWTY